MSSGRNRTCPVGERGSGFLLHAAIGDARAQRAHDDGAKEPDAYGSLHERRQQQGPAPLPSTPPSRRPSRWLVLSVAEDLRVELTTLAHE
jgi:hypothetical protein